MEMINQGCTCPSIALNGGYTLQRDGKDWAFNNPDGTLIRWLSEDEQFFVAGALRAATAPVSDLSAEVLKAIYLECQRGTSAERLHAAVMAVLSAGAPVSEAGQAQGDARITPEFAAKALEALDSMDDYARMESGVSATGPVALLKSFIEVAATQPAAMDEAAELPKCAAYGIVGANGFDPNDGHKQLIGLSVGEPGSHAAGKVVRLYTEGQVRAALAAPQGNSEQAAELPARIVQHVYENLGFRDADLLAADVAGVLALHQPQGAEGGA